MGSVHRLCLVNTQRMKIHVNLIAKLVIAREFTVKFSDQD